LKIHVESIAHWEAQCAVRQLVLEAAIIRVRVEASPLNQAALVKASASWEEGLRNLEDAHLDLGEARPGYLRSNGATRDH
jgi:hypothetical protein